MRNKRSVIFFAVLFVLLLSTNVHAYKNIFSSTETCFDPSLETRLYASWLTRDYYDLDCDTLLAPTAGAQSFCSEAQVSDLVATGQAGATFKWYQDAVGGTVLANTTVLTAGTYYVSQELENCESARTSVVVSFVEADFSNMSVSNYYALNSVTLTQTTIPAPNYEIFYSTSMDLAPTATTAALVLNQTTNTVAITGLNPDTRYYFWGRSVCSATDKGPWILIANHKTVATFPYQEDFEGDHSWNLMNDTRNKWFQGTAARGTTNKSMYISSDAAGGTYAYNFTGANTSHIYKDFYIQDGVTNVSLSFDWKCFGDGFAATKLDYLRVWLVSFEYIPVPGTTITANPQRVLLDNHTFNNNNQFLRYRTVVDLSTLQLSNLGGDFSRVVRVVFEWRNDATDGNQPPAAIDNINIEPVSCLPPTAFTRGNLTQNSIQVSWTPAAGVTNYEVFYSNTAGFIIPDDQAEVLTVNNANTTTITGLTADTNYKIWVRSKCSATNKSIWVGPIATRTAQVPATLPLVEGFENTINWSFDNDVTNKWVVGTAVRTRGTKSLYISNDFGASNGYTLNTAQVSHAYRDISIPMATTDLSLSFDWRNFGEGFAPAAFLDYFRIWLVPTSFVPVPGVEITTATPGVIRVGLNGYNNEQLFVRGNALINLGLGSPVVTTRRLVFEWINNRQLGNQPAAAIDNVEVKVLTCDAPSALVFTEISQNNAVLTWEPPTRAPQGYEIFYDQAGSLPIGSTVPTMTGITAPTANLTGLTPNTVYYLWIRSVCGNGTSYWVGPKRFISGQIPATLPYIDNFEGTNNWTTFFSDTTNKWFVGTAVASGATGRSLYISNDGGGSHQYTLTRNQVSFAYRDVTVPPDTHQLLIEFDWLCRGEGTLANPRDYMKVWMVPTTYIPQEGVPTTAANSDGVQIGSGSYLGVNGFTFERIEGNLNQFEGRTGRLLFEWVNNNASGAQPPAAVDNVKIEVITCPKPSRLGACTEVDTTFFWTPNGGEEEWEVVVEPGFSGLDDPLPTSAVISVMNFPEYVDTTLADGADYTVFVRAVCDVNDKSLWVKHTFKNFSFDVSGANPFCAGNQALIFPNAHGDRNTNNKYQGVGCLGSTPNPVWYFLKIGESGNLNFQIIQNTSANFDGNGLDVDFIAFGPFDDMRQACSEIDLRNPGRNSFACSYSAAPIENFSIPNAVQGQIYVLLITNFNGSPGFIKLEQTGGSGTTDCSFACTVDLGPDLVICGTEEQVLDSRLLMAGEEGEDEPVFLWYKDDELMDPLEYNTPTITVTESGTYRVEVQKDFCSQNPVDEINVLFVEEYTGIRPAGKIVCDEDPESEVPLENDGLYKFKLAEYAASYIALDGDPASLTFSYHENLDDAERDRNPIDLTTPYESGSKVIYFRVTRHGAKKCAWIFSYELEVRPTVYNNPEFDIQTVICLTNDDFITPELAEEATLGGSFSYSILTFGDGEKRKLAINKNTGVIDVKASDVGKYSVIYTVYVPAEHCGSVESKSIDIEIVDQFTIVEEGDCVKGEYHLRVVDLVGKEKYNEDSKYEWTGPDDFKAEGKVIVVPKIGRYHVLVTTPEGCYEEAEIELENINCMIQKGISPNGDGLNDYFDLSNYDVLKFTVHNRYGTEVYLGKTGYTTQWYGQDKQGNLLPDGTYFYQIVTLTEVLTGWVQINK